MPITCFAACPRNIEELLQKELESFEAVQTRTVPSGVHFSGSLETVYRICLWSRLASRILLPLAVFPAPTSEALYHGAAAVPWWEHMEASDTLAVDAAGTTSGLIHTVYAAQVVKDAVADRFRERTGSRPSVDTAQPDIRLNLRLRNDEAILSIDLSGESLHRRGYRKESVEAPLKENVAAALLIRAGWAEIITRGGALVDPMCGSGTIPIEGALIAGDIAPGLLRERWGFSRWKGHDPVLWEKLLAEARERRDRGIAELPVIAGYDEDPAAIAAARINAGAAGLTDRIRFEPSEIPEAAPPPGTTGGLVAVNPPYGERLEPDSDLPGLYRVMGQALKKRFRGWRVAILTSSPELAGATGLRAHRIHRLYNGTIPCSLYHFRVRSSDVPDEEPARKPAAKDKPKQPRIRIKGAAETPKEAKTPPEPRLPVRSGTEPAPAGGEGETAQPAGEGARRVVRVKRMETPVPIPGHIPERIAESASMFANRLQKNLRLLGKEARRQGVTCFRIYDGDLPDFNMAVDFYEGTWANVQEFKAPPEVDPEKAQQRVEAAVPVIAEILGIPRDRVFLKQRRRQRGKEQYRPTAAGGVLHEVHEGDYRFLVNFTDYLDTGLFLDHRPIRGMIGRLARGKRFLNLFSYTGTATVYAAGGEAAETLSVDNSNTYNTWARRNLELNGFSGRQHRFLKADCIEWLRESDERFDLIFLDPPTFSNSKGTEQDMDIQRDHVMMIRLAMKHLEPSGLLVFSTNYRRFRIDFDALSGLTIRLYSRETIPFDFQRSPRIHQCFLISSGPVRLPPQTDRDRAGGTAPNMERNPPRG